MILISQNNEKTRFISITSTWVKSSWNGHPFSRPYLFYRAFNECTENVVQKGCQCLPKYGLGIHRCFYMNWWFQKNDLNMPGTELLGIVGFLHFYAQHRFRSFNQQWTAPISIFFMLYCQLRLIFVYKSHDLFSLKVWTYYKVFGFPCKHIFLISCG